MTTGLIKQGKFSYSIRGNAYSEKSWDGSDDPNHTKFNPWSVTFFSNYIPTDMQYYSAGQWLITDPYETGHIGWDSTFVLSSNDINSALNRLMVKVRGHSFNLSTFLGESKESASMILENVLTLTSAFKDFKHGKFQTAYAQLITGRERVLKRRVFVGKLAQQVKRLRPIKDWRSFYSKDVNSRFLMMEYGWFPLIADINELIKSIDVDRERVRTKIFKIKSSYTVKRQGIRWAVTGIFGQYRKSERSIRYTCRYNLSGYEHAIENFDFYDLASTAYQLTTLSFVLDWFLPIGDYLEALTAAQILNQLNTTYTTRSYDEITGYVYPNSLRRGGESFRETRVVYSRAKGVKAQLPSWKNPLNGSFKRVADAIALMRARIR